MKAVFSLLNTAAPLLLLTLGALSSEYGGRLAMFMECIINLSGFFCFAFTVWTGNVFLGIALSIFVCTIMVFLMERLSSKFGANMFLASLAMNLLFAAGTTFFSSVFFGTRGVLTNEAFKFDAAVARFATSILCYGLSAGLLFFLICTRSGMILRITGSDEEVLEARGISSQKYKCASWLIAAASGAVCGCTLAVRISSFVPGMSGGRGWTALAAVFLSRKNGALVPLAVAVFAIAEYASTRLQFIGIPSGILLALPYIMSLLLIALVPGKK